MRIRELFGRDIERHINAAVVVGDDKQEVVEAEITEYVFTRDLVNHIYKLLNTILNNKQGKTGVWINGYFGSGKSHFLKYIHYCLHPKYKEKALGHLEEALSSINTDLDDVTPSQFRALRKQLEKTDVDTILFNVDNVSGDQQSERLARVFLNQFNKFRGYNASNIPLARLLEKQLDKQGVFETFKERLREKKFDWEKDADTISRLRMDTVLSIAAELMPGTSTDMVKTALKDPSTYHISVADTLIPEFQEYLAGKDATYRLVFLIDEVSQYVGQNKNLLLNLQTIVEGVSELLNNQVWIACTAQQDLGEVVHGVESKDHKDEFGKILGRFDTRISLESNDPTYITQKRVLDKNAGGLKALADLYRQNRDAIEHQFNLGNSLYRGYNHAEEFELSYPFIPYQFKLIGDVLDAFQRLRFVITQVKDNARSVIGLTHYTAKHWADKEVGTFIPFDAFLSGQLRQNMQNAGTRALDRPLELPWIKRDSFEERVVKNLFMISNLNHDVLQTFPPTVENIATLMMTKLDENKLELQKKVTDVIGKLKDASMIREENGRFFFYNEDEIAVTNLISTQPLNLDEKYTELDKTFFRKILKIDPKWSIGKNDFKIIYWLDDKEVFRNGDVRVSLHVLDDAKLETKNLHTPADELVVGINEWFAADTGLKKDFDWYCRTKYYLERNAAAATGERKKTNENFALRNKQLEDALTGRFRQGFLSTRYISQQRIMDATEINGATPADRYADALEKHLLAVYNKMELANDYAFTEQDLRAAARNPQIPLPELTPAETLVNDYISTSGNTATVEDIINKFEKRPFGWKHTQVIHLLVALQKKKKREFAYNNEPRYPLAEFVEKAINSRERSRCVVSSAEEISAADIDNTIASFREIFNQDIAHTTDGAKLFGEITDWLAQYKAVMQPLAKTWYGKQPFGAPLQRYYEKLSAWLQEKDMRKLFTTLVAEKERAKEIHDAAKAVQDFITRMYGEWEKMRQFVEENRTNFPLLKEEDVAKSNELSEYLKAELPHVDFRHKKRAYEELKGSVKELVEALQKETLERYNALFDELEREADLRKVDRITALPDREIKLEKIRKTKAISELQLLKANAGSYKSGILEVILKHEAEQKAAADRAKGKEAVEVAEVVPFYISRVKASITSEAELADFLDKLKAEMLHLLQSNKTIIIKE